MIDTPRLNPRSLVTVLLGAALTLSATAALAQSASDARTPHSNGDVQTTNTNQTLTTEEITVRARGEARHETVGKNYAGIPIEQITLTREVGYHDIDIHSPSGIATLRRRIDMTAQDACSELTGLYPHNVWSSTMQECVHRAVSSALEQLPSDVAAAVDTRATSRPR